jgi:hypothetical protein
MPMHVQKDCVRPMVSHSGIVRSIQTQVVFDRIDDRILMLIARTMVNDNLQGCDMCSHTTVQRMSSGLLLSIGLAAIGVLTALAFT